MTTIPFTKLVGTGNDFVIVDTRRHPLGSLNTQWRAVSRALCDRRLGIGADGLLVLEPSRVADVKMRVWNPDGSEATMCGNGARCVALYLNRTRVGAGHVARGKAIVIETKAGMITANAQGKRVAIRMPEPTALQLGLALRAGQQRFRAGFVNTGVPHLVIPVSALDQLDVNRIGRILRSHPQFAPAGTNVDFVQRDECRPNRLRVRTYERGVEGETLACGTGVTASALLSALEHRSRQERNGSARPCRVDVETRSGDILTVSFRIRSTGQRPYVTDVVLQGTARMVFEGRVQWPQRSE